MYIRQPSTKEKDLDELIDPNFFKILKEIMTNLPTSKIESKELILILNEKLNIIDQLGSILYMKPQPQLQSDTKKKNESSISSMTSVNPQLIDDQIIQEAVEGKTPEFILKQYNLLKQFIINNTIEVQVSAKNYKYEGQPFMNQSDGMFYINVKKSSTIRLKKEDIVSSNRRQTVSIPYSNAESNPSKIMVPLKIVKIKSLLRIFEDIENRSFFKKILRLQPKISHNLGKQTEVGPNLQESDYSKIAKEFELNKIKMMQKIQGVTMKDNYQAMYEYLNTLE